MQEFSSALARFGPQQSAAAALAPAQRQRGRLGEILVSEGMVSQEAMDQALLEQRRTGQLLGRVLLERDLVGRADLLAALARQQGIPSSLPPRVGPDAMRRKTETVRIEHGPAAGRMRLRLPMLRSVGRVIPARWVPVALAVSIAVAAVAAALAK